MNENLSSMDIIDGRDDEDTSLCYDSACEVYSVSSGDTDTAIDQNSIQKQLSAGEKFLNRYFRTFVPKFGRNSPLAWDLLKSLLDILGPLHDLDWMMTEESFRKQVIQQFGVVNSHRCRQVNEDVDELMNSTTRL